MPDLPATDKHMGFETNGIYRQIVLLKRVMLVLIALIVLGSVGKIVWDKIIFDRDVAAVNKTRQAEIVQILAAIEESNTTGRDRAVEELTVAIRANGVKLDEVLAILKKSGAQ